MEKQHCINCDSAQTRKNGIISSGAQRYKCLPCNKYFSIGGKHGTYSQEFKEEIICAYKHKHISARKVSKLFNIALSTIVTRGKTANQNCTHCDKKNQD